MAQDENSTAALWTCPQCGGTQYSGMMHICLTAAKHQQPLLPALGQADEITRPGGLRDQFAMAALPLLIESELQSRSMPPNPRRPSPIPAAEGAYKWADAMLEARKK